MAKTKTDMATPELLLDTVAEGKKDAVKAGADEARERMSREDGSPLRGERTRGEDASRGKEKTNRARKEGVKTTSTKTAPKGSGKGEEGQGATKTSPVYVRLSGAMLEAVDKSVEQSPIEFGDRSEFIRRAIESELRRRGMLPTYK